MISLSEVKLTSATRASLDRECPTARSLHMEEFATTLIGVGAVDH